MSRPQPTKLFEEIVRLAQRAEIFTNNYVEGFGVEIFELPGNFGLEKLVGIGLYATLGKKAVGFFNWATPGVQTDDAACASLECRQAPIAPTAIDIQNSGVLQ